MYLPSESKGVAIARGPAEAVPGMRHAVAAFLRRYAVAMLVATAIIAVVGSLVWLGRDTFSLQGLKATIVSLEAAKAGNPVLIAALLFLSYIAVTALCIPLEVPFALATGALFGVVEGVVLASFASVFGATLAFWGSRFLFRERLSTRFSRQLATVNAGVAANGAFYVMSLRLQPVLPFSLVNVLMGLTSMRTSVFYVTSQISMIFATIIFVNAGTQLLNIQHYSDIMSPSLICGLAALGVLPLASKMVLKAIARLRPQPLAEV